MSKALKRWAFNWAVCAAEVLAALFTHNSTGFTLLMVGLAGVMFTIGLYWASVYFDLRSG